MDIGTTTAPKSDQQNFDDYMGGPKTVTITEVVVRDVAGEQPVAIHLAEFPGRPYKPSKTMRRVLDAAWHGVDTDDYAGRRMTLYGDPEVKFGGQKVGGIKIRALSHIGQRLTFNLTETKGKKAPHTVEPLPDATPAPTAADIAAVTDQDVLKAMYHAHPHLQAAIRARKAELEATS
jgi:hypothetical protein